MNRIKWISSSHHNTRKTRKKRKIFFILPLQWRWDYPVLRCYMISHPNLCFIIIPLVFCFLIPSITHFNNNFWFFFDISSLLPLLVGPKMHDLTCVYNIYLYFSIYLYFIISRLRFSFVLFNCISFFFLSKNFYFLFISRRIKCCWCFFLFFLFLDLNMKNMELICILTIFVVFRFCNTQIYTTVCGIIEIILQ